jgi:hypothetical protein
MQIEDTMEVNAKADLRKFTLRLGPEAVQELEWISRQYGGISLSEVFRRAVATEKYLLEQQKAGQAIILENKMTGRQRELTFR